MSLLSPSKKQKKKFLNPVPTVLGGPAMIFKFLPMYFRNKAEVTPRIPLGPFQTEADAYSAQSDFRVTWFGHSSTLLEIDGVTVLTDPVWDERAAPVQWAGPKRFFPPTIDLADLPSIDVVLLSHDHYDHLGAGTVRALARTRPEMCWVTSLKVGAQLRAFGVRADRITELDWTERTRVVGAQGAWLEITSLPARHFSGRSAFNRNETLWASFAIAGPRHKVYYGADTGPWDGLAEIGKQYGPFDLTMLEIGAYNALWGNIHLGPDGASAAFGQMGAGGLLMPIHWGLFNLAFHAWNEPIARVTELAKQQGYDLFSPEPGRPEPVRELRSGWWKQGRG